MNHELRQIEIELKDIEAEFNRAGSTMPAIVLAQRLAEIRAKRDAARFRADCAEPAIPNPAPVPARAQEYPRPTWIDINKMLEAVAGAFENHSKHIAAQKTSIEKLETLVAELEARPALKYRGTWDAMECYVPGDFATMRGSIWACIEPTKSQPGTDKTWQLSVKRGADGKDAR